jgi:uncharacterized protein (DUF1330 family)
MPRLTLVAILTVRRDRIDAFHRFERSAALVMSRHGGAIERTVAVDDASAEHYREVHVVTFPDAASFSAYRVDPALAALADLRQQAIVATDLLVGHDGPTYSPA